MGKPESLNDIYHEASQAIRQSRIREWDKRDSVFLTVTTGSLALSVSFLTISGFGTTVQPHILVWSWIALLVSIILQLLAYISVDRHFIKFENALKGWYEAGLDLTRVPSEATTWGKITTALNYTSYLLTIVGLILLVVFGWYNVNAMANSSDGKKFANPITPATLPTSTQPSTTTPAPAVTPAPSSPSKG